jgi:hypothetical protein
MKTYAIINEGGEWLENLVLWDGNITTWQPPEGTIAVPADDVDFSALPESPEE